jgi:hypothetical protein
MKVFKAVVAAALLLIGSSGAVLSADTPVPHAVHHHRHPRRRQIRRRLRRQRHRINRKERRGKISAAQAQNLRNNDNAIQHEDQGMAGQDNGHLTQQDQGALNQQLNQNSGAIHNNQ